MTKSNMVTISVIIPALSNSEDLPVLFSLKNIDYPEDKIEIILSVGRWPSVQRNHAARMSKGDILYFFNRDSQVELDLFKKVVSIFNSDEKIAGIGGPDLTPVNNNYLQHLFGYAMGSYFAHWKMRARYTPIGGKRLSNERELLLSNLAIRKDIYLKAHGFYEKLYPNEENELINRITKMGYKFIYSPDIKIYRDRRKTLFAFARQFYRYGQGRVSQVFIEGLLKNLQFFIPLFLLIYFLILPFAKKFWISFIPLFIYITSGIIDAIYLSFKNKKNLVLELPILYMIMHISYGIGMLTAIYNKIVARNNDIGQEDSCKVIYIKEFNKLIYNCI